MLILLWVLFAILVASFASKRGHSPILAFFIAVVLSPIVGALIILIMKPNQEEIEKKEMKSGSVKKCTQCAELIKSEAKICKHCQTIVENI